MGAPTWPSVPDPDPTIHAVIHGPVNGQLAIGEKIYQNKIENYFGAVINHAPVTERMSPRARSRPVHLRPRPFPGLLDRQTEITTATATLLAGEPMEFSGDDGMGKTSLLRAVAHHPTSGSFRDGVIWLRAGQQPASDLLQVLFDAFYEWDVPSKPTEGQLRHALSTVQALVLCDDVDLPREELEVLLDGAPYCTFILAAADRRLWSVGRSQALTGLPYQEALTLVERELGRTLSQDELEAVQALHVALDGHPLRILQAAARVRTEGQAFADILRWLRPGASSTTMMMDKLLPALPEPQRRILSVLAAIGGAPIGAARAGAIAQISDPEPVLQSLMERHLTSTSGNGYRAVAAMDSGRASDLDEVRERALAHFVSWAEENRRVPERILQEADAVLRLLKWAGENGRQTEVVRLGRAVDGALALGMRWGAWQQVLRLVLRAARELGDPIEQAWALHQLGTRVACLGDSAAARMALTEALRLRVDQGDRIGVAVTRHNLNVLAPPSVQPDTPTQPIARPDTPTQPIARPDTPTRPIVRSRTRFSLLPVAALLLATLGGGWLVLAQDDNNSNDNGEPTEILVTSTVTEPATERATERVTEPATERVTEPSAVAVTANGQDKVYGQDDPPLTYSIDGGAGGDAFTGELQREEGEDAGTYTITQGTLDLTNPNYTLRFVEGSFTINPAPVTVTADDHDKVYGQDDPPLTYSTDSEDDVTGDLQREEGEDVGTYTITQGTLELTNPNYTLRFVEGSFTISPAPVTVTGDDHDKTYGQDDPELTVVIDGGAGKDDFTGELQREEGEEFGTYDITQGTLELTNPNYTLRFVEGTFTIESDVE